MLDPKSGIAKLCDFGSSKILVAGEPNVAYICSRYYRAPELVFGAVNYTTSIDVWSTGCVMAELMLGQPLFQGESSIDQLIEIIKVLGTPSKEQIKAMNPSYTEHKIPQVKPSTWARVFRSRPTTPESLDLLSKLLEYTPTARLTAIEVLTHPFFDELRQKDCKMPDNTALPPLFNFSSLGTFSLFIQLELSIRPDLNKLLVPSHAQEKLKEQGIDLDTFQPISIQKASIN